MKDVYLLQEGRNIFFSKIFITWILTTKDNCETAVVDFVLWWPLNIPEHISLTITSPSIFLTTSCRHVMCRNSSSELCDLLLLFIQSRKLRKKTNFLSLAHNFPFATIFVTWYSHRELSPNITHWCSPPTSISYSKQQNASQVFAQSNT